MSELPDLLGAYLEDPEKGMTAIRHAISRARRRGDVGALRTYTRLMGQFHMVAREYGQALRWFRRHLRLHPNSPAGHWGLGQCLGRLGRLEEGWASLREAQRLGYPGDPEEVDAFAVPPRVVYRLLRVCEALERELGRAPSVPEIASRFYPSLDLEEYRRMAQEGRPVSLAEQAEGLRQREEFRQVRLGDLLATLGGLAPSRVLLSRLVRRLRKLERIFVERRAGLDEPALTLEAAAAELGRSPREVGEWEVRLFRRLLS